MTDFYRYSTINFVNVAIPTLGGLVTDSAKAVTTGFVFPGTSIGSYDYLLNYSLGSNDANATYDGILAIWDAYNGQRSDSGYVGYGAGAPLAWLQDGKYLPVNVRTATSNGDGHYYFTMNGFAFSASDANISAVGNVILVGLTQVELS